MVQQGVLHDGMLSEKTLCCEACDGLLRVTCTCIMRVASANGERFLPAVTPLKPPSTANMVPPSVGLSETHPLINHPADMVCSHFSPGRLFAEILFWVSQLRKSPRLGALSVRPEWMGRYLELDYLTITVTRVTRPVMFS